MGLDAFVRCRCFERRRTTPPPCPREWLRIDEDGVLDLVPEHDDDALWHRVSDWSRSACAHPSMHLVHERVGNWSTVRRLQAFLERTGEAPTALAEIPDANGGNTSVEAARACAHELRHLPDAAVVRPAVTDDAGGVLFHAVAAYGGIFAWSRGREIGVDERGIFVAEGGAVRFRARRVRQEGERFVCEDTGASWPAGPIADGVRLRHALVREDAASFAEPIGTLLRLFDAAVATGGPVHWT